jgi:hypothetical protein
MSWVLKSPGYLQLAGEPAMMLGTGLNLSLTQFCAVLVLKMALRPRPYRHVVRLRCRYAAEFGEAVVAQLCCQSQRGPSTRTMDLLMRLTSSCRRGRLGSISEQPSITVSVAFLAPIRPPETSTLTKLAVGYFSLMHSLTRRLVAVWRSRSIVCATDPGSARLRSRLSRLCKHASLQAPLT